MSQQRLPLKLKKARSRKPNKTRARYLKSGGLREWVIQAEIIAWLETTDLLWWRQNAGVMFVRGRKVHLGPPGAADISVVGPTGRFHGLEVKTAKGKPNKDQIEYARRLTVSGGSYFIVRSLHQAMDAVAEVIGAR
jgi:hypothetical protein